MSWAQSQIRHTNTAYHLRYAVSRFDDPSNPDTAHRYSKRNVFDMPGCRVAAHTPLNDIGGSERPQPDSTSTHRDVTLQPAGSALILGVLIRPTPRDLPVCPFSQLPAYAKRRTLPVNPAPRGHCTNPAERCANTEVNARS
jgi:hypothetical protein